jgi:DGQHR domain-containing protein
MKKYKVTDLVKILSNSNIQTFHIEGITFPLIDEEPLIKQGKRKNEATKGELDALAVIHKLILLMEFTTERAINTYDFDNFVRKLEILNERRDYLRELINKVNTVNQQSVVIADDSRIVGLYVNPSLTSVQAKTLQGRLTSSNNNLIHIWDCDTFEYFKVISNAIRRFAKFELFSYFNVAPEIVFESRELEFRASAKPYEAIKIEKGVFGYPTYTFKIKPNALLDRCYVLRNEGFRSDSFQRMVMAKKLSNIRKYIVSYRNTSFANNIIISPSPDVDVNTIVEERNKDKVEVRLPCNFCTFCIIDGQHRLLAFTQDFYGENERKEQENDKILRKLADDSDIIVTMVRFSGTRDDILRQQATLFRDINSNQTKVKADFLYNLEEIIDPSSSGSIGNRIVRYLNNLEDGIFKDKFELKTLPSYSGRIKRSSIVRYGLKELVEIDKGLLYLQSPDQIKNEMQEKNYESYVHFCGKKLDTFFRCVREVFKDKYGEEVWGTKKKTGFLLLSTSSIIGFLRLYRHFIKSNVLDEKEIKKHLDCITVNFGKDNYNYTSSQWPKLEEKMLKDIRKKFKDFGDNSLIKRSK